MPYKSIRDLPVTVKVLPYSAQRLFLRVFNQAIKDKKTEEEAFSLAWGVVKRFYSKEGNKWVKIKK